MAASELAFLPIAPDDEFLHPPPPGADHTAIETSYFGFHLPEHAIDGELYVWFHTTLDIMGIQIFVNKGHKTQQLEAEYHMHHDFLPMVRNNSDYSAKLGSCTFKVKVVDPLKTVHIRIDDPRAGFQIDMTSRAAAPPVGRPGGKHFTQLMDNDGVLILRGEKFKISGNFVRDRSWSQLRGEDPQPGPPACWITGCFGNHQAFHVSLLDTSILDMPEFGPRWSEHLDKNQVLSSIKWESGGATAEVDLRGGWWYDGTRFRQIRAARKTTTLAADGLSTRRCTLELIDDVSEKHVAEGVSLTTLPKMYGQNLVVYLNQTRWQMDGKIGVGVLETVFCNEHVYKLSLQRAKGGR
jgi:hypothetical protein